MVIYHCVKESGATGLSEIGAYAAVEGFWKRRVGVRWSSTDDRGC